MSWGLTLARVKGTAMSEYVDTVELDYWLTHCIDCEEAIPAGDVSCEPCATEAATRCRGCGTDLGPEPEQPVLCGYCRV